ncbi:MAG: ferrous iron transport protein B [Muribaculaceae bacterium]|nr:ferrous iron transport protein B [Muribaculaceae bacterium]
MRLSDLKTGESAVIVKILGHGAFRKRVMEMGFVKGRKITALLAAPLRDPVKYRLMNYEVSLRRTEASLIEVMPINVSSVKEDNRPEKDAGSHLAFASDHTMVDDGALDEHSHGEFVGRRHTINVALIGNPNCGKTSLFNIASGAKEHVGNYSGVTVDSKTGTFRHGGYTFNIVDLPGTYSLSAYSPEERYVRTYLKDHNPDVIVNVVDASNLERNLYLTTELIDMDHSMVIALNMYDELRRSGAVLDYEALGNMIGVPVVPTVSRTGEGVDRLFDTIIQVYEGKNPVVRHVHVKLSQDLEKSLSEIKDALKRDKTINQQFCARYLGIKLLERDAEIEELVRESKKADELLALRNRQLEYLERHNPGEDISSLIADDKYGFISGALAETMKQPQEQAVSTTHILDAFVTSRLFGFPLFLCVMAFIFWFTFFIGAYPADWIQEGIDWLAAFVKENMAPGPLKDLLANGVIGGVGGVIVFLPNIMILFFFISFMEDSGYMARAAFIMDKLMHKIGLHGKSFIPLVMGFGCNVPAVMACRAIESRSSKIITVLITPFMSCSARLPVYVLLIGTFFSAHAALVFLGMYLLGAVVAMVTARMLRRFFFKVDETPFVMELPPYRVPTMKTSLRHMWWKGKQYLQKMGGIILVASVIVWALDYFPLGNADDPSRDSYLESVGKTVQPVMEPLGCSWQGTVAIVAGIPAKEIVVSTLGVLYTGSDEATDQALSTRLTALNPATGEPDFTPAAALAFMIFILLYCPCLATVVAIVKETGHWGYGAFTIFYNTAVAWILAFAAYRIMLLF